MLKRVLVSKEFDVALGIIGILNIVFASFCFKNDKRFKDIK